MQQWNIKLLKQVIKKLIAISYWWKDVEQYWENMYLS